MLAIGEDRQLKINDDYYQRGINACQREEYQNAINNFTRAINLNSNFEVAIKNKAIAEQELKDIKRKQEEEEQHKREELKRRQDAEQRQKEELKRRQDAEENRKRRLENFSVVNTLTGHFGAVYCLAISPDGKPLVSGSADRTIKIWRSP